jgi:hypothetical protein
MGDPHDHLWTATQAHRLVVGIVIHPLAIGHHIVRAHELAQFLKHIRIYLVVHVSSL